MKAEYLRDFFALSSVPVPFLPCNNNDHLDVRAETNGLMKTGMKMVLGVIAISCGLSGCKKDNGSRQTVSFSNQPLNTVLDAIKGRWRAVYYTSVTIAGFSKIPAADTALGYYTRFYPDHITYSNKGGDSLSGPISWQRVAYDSDSVYAFLSQSDRNALFGSGYAVLDIVNDTLDIATVNHGIDYGGGIVYKKD